jgi:hypothetical protein
MPNLFENLLDYFGRDDWPVEKVPGQTALQLNIHTDTLAWTCFAQALEEEEQFAFFSIVPVLVPPESRAVVAEYLHRANFNLILGNFEMDMDTGEVRFKTSIDFEGDELSFELFRPVVYANLSMMERYLPGLLQVAQDGADPKQAIADAEDGEPA